MNRRTTLVASVLSLVVISAFLATALPAGAQSTPGRTLGILHRDLRAYDGYTLYKNLGDKYVYLLNNAGNPVHNWKIPDPPPLTTRPGGEVFLRKNGELILTAEEGIYALNPDSTVAWKIDSRDLGSGRWFGHHEVVELPNGHMLLPGFIEKTRQEAIDAGFDVIGADACATPDLVTLRVDNIWELAPVDPKCGFKCGWTVVWRWNLWDHIVQNKDNTKLNYVAYLADYPGKADIGYVDPAEGICGNYIQGAWTFGRFNALGYHPWRNEIVISESLMNEVWIINHAVSTEQAIGSAGELLYRWGNPYAYGTGAPFQDKNDRGDQKLSFQHRVQWIAPGFHGAGNLLIFNNGTDWGDSSVIEIRPPIDIKGNYVRVAGKPFGPAAPEWQYDEYDTPGSFFAPLISSAQRLRNGNTLINNGPAGYIFEVTEQGEKVWEYLNPVLDAAQGSIGKGQMIYRAWRYDPSFPGLPGKTLTPGDPLEKYPIIHAVDILPGFCGNPVILICKGVLPVAILGSKDLDVTKIDPRSIKLEGFAPVRWSIEDVGAPGKCCGRDGYYDLVLKYDSAVVGAALANVPNRSETLLRLTGYSPAGWFLGKDKAFVMNNLFPFRPSRFKQY